jgi:hypothetical protein
MNRRFLSILSGSYTVKVRHYIGMPPELTDGVDQRTLMGASAFIIIEEDPEGVFLFRYDSKGKCVGDTWHQTIEDAKDQAAYEYEDALGAWQTVPPELEDVVAYGVTSLRH